MHLFILAVFIAGVLGSPLLKRNTISAKNLIQIAPSSASCINAPAVNECRTASQAAPNIATSFSLFGIDDFNTQAALVALMIYESASFKYSQNHYPGVPGQGTRNMQSPSYNARYARFLSGIERSGITPADLQNKQPADILALVNNDLWSFSSAAWFLTSQCSESVRVGLSQGTQAGWSTYLTQCIGTTATSDRTLVWDAVKGLGQWST